MARYFTSDLHLGSTYINKYASRPFASGKEAIDKLIDNCNATASSKLDTLIHVGDFALDGVDRHDGEDESCLGCSIRELPLFFNARLVLLAGNHDDGHNVTTDAKSMILDLNQNYRNVTVSHYPSYHERFMSPNDNCWKWFDAQKMYVHVHLCGHVHDKWILNFDAAKNVLNYNVGVDCHNYKPVRDSEITELLDYVFREREFRFTWQQTRAEFDLWKKNNDLLLAELRAQRKQEKHLKKGLTPEECERRKIEAMKKKGLI